MSKKQKVLKKIDIPMPSVEVGGKIKLGDGTMAAVTDIMACYIVGKQRWEFWYELNYQEGNWVQLYQNKSNRL